jgi:hypothetical protein
VAARRPAEVNPAEKQLPGFTFQEKRIHFILLEAWLEWQQPPTDTEGGNHRGRHPIYRGVARREPGRQPAHPFQEVVRGMGMAAAQRRSITYLLRHWKGLTLFLREARAPLDNNLVERSLKRAVLHRKNALFYRTLNGAQVGDLFMSLIHTAELCGANSFDYLTELQRHAQELVVNPAEWMPWNYRQTLEPPDVR